MTETLAGITMTVPVVAKLRQEWLTRTVDTADCPRCREIAADLEAADDA